MDDKSIQSATKPDAVPASSKAPSMWRELRKSFRKWFWDQVGLEDIAGDVETHGEAVRKAAIVRFILAIAIICVISVASGTAYYLNEQHAEDSRQVQADHERQLRERDARRHKAEREADAMRAERDRAVIELQPWKDRAKKEFPFDDITSALAKLDAKTETVLAMFRSSIVNPLNEPINAATCTVSIETTADTGDGSHMMSGAYAAFGADGNVLLLARATSYLAMPKGKFQFVAPASVFDPMMDKPVNALVKAQFIQIGFGEGALAGATSVVRGTVVWVINNRITLRYNIPPQILTANAKELQIFVRDLRPGVEQLEQMARQQVSSVPDSSSGKDTQLRKPDR